MAVATTAIALIAVLLVVLRPEAGVILTVPVVLLAKGHERYLDERADGQVLRMIYTLARDTRDPALPTGPPHSRVRARKGLR